MNKAYDIVIVGGGPAGLAAAIAARESGTQSVIILERGEQLGGILNQCIHNGFGLHTFKEELTGPEYAHRFIQKVIDMGIEYKLDTMVMDISPERAVTAMNREDGMFVIDAKAVILAMGCRERPRGALNIPGYRPAGIFSAGTAQRLVNIEGYMPGREVVILGSGDIGLIMARRTGGLKRNIVQCLDDFGIPLLLSHTVVDIEGKEHITAVTIAEVGADRRPIKGTEVRYTCDTLLLSCGLIPENELSTSAGVRLSPITNGPVVNESLETSIPGVFACGNVLHVHDLVDYVSEEAAKAGQTAARYAQGAVEKGGREIEIHAGGGARYTVPSTVCIDRMDDRLTVRFRAGDVYKDAYVSVYFDEARVMRKKKRIIAPGEMEQIILSREQMKEYPDLKTITVKIER